MAGASVTKTAQLARVSIRTVTKVTSAFRSVGKTSVNRVGSCGRQRTFDNCALMWYARKNRRATLPQVTENVIAGRDQTVSKNSPSTIT